MDRLERIRGCLLGGAAGDALGYQVEFTLLDAMIKQHGKHGVRTMAPYISDDTQMTLFTAEGLLMGQKHDMPVPACIYQSYLDWYKTQLPHTRGGVFAGESELLKGERLYRQEAPGITCMSALGGGDMGDLENPINRSKGCGGVMRTAPCGMLKLMDTPDPEDAYAMQGALAAAITHGHVLGYVPAAMLADMVHMILLEDGRSLEEIILASLEHMQRLFPYPATRELADLIRRAMELAEEDIADTQAIGQLGRGWVGEEALAIAVFCALRYQDNLAECLIAAVTHDGDSDSTGAIAGNILGAWLGASAIPAEWLETIEARDIVERMAVRIHEAV